MVENNYIIKLSEKRINGYMYFCDRKHPLCNSQGYVYYHRHVASLKIGRWLNKDEHVHHIDGNKVNNSPENLDVLTPSEHATLEAGKKKKPLKFCSVCGEILSRKNSGGKCINHIRKFNPTKEELEKLIWEMATTKVAEIFGVSDKAVEKRCKLFGIEKPPRGYWAKKYAEKLQ